METIETVKIVSSAPETDGYIVINKDDFDDKTMNLYKDTPDDTERAELIGLAVFYKLASPSTLERWGLDRLRAEVAKAQADAAAV